MSELDLPFDSSEDSEPDSASDSDSESDSESDSQAEYLYDREVFSVTPINLPDTSGRVQKELLEEGIQKCGLLIKSSENFYVGEKSMHSFGSIFKKVGKRAVEMYYPIESFDAEVLKKPCSICLGAAKYGVKLQKNFALGVNPGYDEEMFEEMRDWKERGIKAPHKVFTSRVEGVLDGVYFCEKDYSEFFLMLLISELRAKFTSVVVKEYLDEYHIDLEAVICKQKSQFRGDDEWHVPVGVANLLEEVAVRAKLVIQSSISDDYFHTIGDCDGQKGLSIFQYFNAAVGSGASIERDALLMFTVFEFHKQLKLLFSKNKRTGQPYDPFCTDCGDYFPNIAVSRLGEFEIR